MDIFHGKSSMNEIDGSNINIPRVKVDLQFLICPLLRVLEHV
jgi:hypothetical protein